MEVIYTTYDELYSTFMDNSLADEIDLPQTDGEIYREIRNAIKLYNNQERKDVLCDDLQEHVGRLLNNDEILMIAYYIKLTFLKRQRMAFGLTYQPFDKDIGLRNYDSQIRAMDRQIAEANKEIQVFKYNKEESIF